MPDDTFSRDNATFAFAGDFWAGPPSDFLRFYADWGPLPDYLLTFGGGFQLALDQPVAPWDGSAFDPQPDFVVVTPPAR